MLTPEQLEREIEEKKIDLETFREAYSILLSRLTYLKDNSMSQMPLHEWAGAHAIMNMMDVVLHNMEHVLEELSPGPSIETLIAMVNKNVKN